MAPLTAFVSFPSHYTQTLLLSTLVAALPAVSLTLVPPAEDQDPPRLQWADYDLLSLDKPHAEPDKYLISSYIYRKALIRKHQLHQTITEWLAKAQHRGYPSLLTPQAGGWARGWLVDIQFADELDELWADELYELGEDLKENEDKADGGKKWFILKPGFADRAQGIRLFSTRQQLQEIFESFEPDSDDESDLGPTNQVEAYREFKKEADKAIAAMRAAKGLPPDSSDEEEEESEPEDEIDTGTTVSTSQLRHFVIQDYVPRPVLFDVGQTPNDPESAITGSKFHLRAYVLITGSYTVHLSRTMLALFSGSPYSTPQSTTQGQMDLAPHLTNTCLQTDAFGVPSAPEHLVKLFFELEGLTALTNGKDGYKPVGTVDKAWLDTTFDRVGAVIAESVKAGAECGSFGLQLMPNAFEIFGVDLLLSFPEGADIPSGSGSGSGSLPDPRVTLLEYNASPDFHQSGNRLRPQLGELFRGVVEISVKPFFGLGDAATEQAVGEEAYGWRLVGKGEVRGPSA